MNNLFICEFPWQVDRLKKQISKDDIVISFNAATNYALEREGINFSDSRDYYDHEYFWRQYPKYLKLVTELCNRLDQIIREADPRFKIEQFRVSDLLFYQLKIAIDQILSRIHIAHEILRRNKQVSRVTCCSRKVPALDGRLFYTDRFSIFSWIFSTIQDQVGYQMQFTRFPMRCPPFHEKLKKTIRSILRSSLKKLSQAEVPFSDQVDIRVLSINCPDMDTIAKSLIPHGIQVESHQSPPFRLVNSNYPHSSEILRTIEQDQTIREKLCIQGVDAFDLILPIVSRFVSALEHFQDGYRATKTLLDKMNVDCVFVRSLSPHHPSNIYLSHLCKQRDIPLVCWMHGGYANYSIPLDVTDYRLGKLHFVYGNAVRDALNSEKCSLKLLGFQGHEVYVTGSPMWEEKYRNYIRPNNDRKKVLLALGNIRVYNQWRLGEDRPYMEYCNWELHRAIIDLFIEYQNRYEFVIKDYPSPEVNMEGTWLNLLKDKGGHEIRLITDEEPFEEVLASSDLCILTWISTTFMQSLLTDVDIFLLDQSDITEEARVLFEAYIGFSDNIHDFIAKLRSYLDAGVFYSQDKGPVRDYFMDYSHKNGRADTVAEMIHNVVGEPESNFVYPQEVHA